MLRSNFGLYRCPNHLNKKNSFKHSLKLKFPSDDTPGTFAEPWDYSEASYDADWQQQMKLLVPALQLVCGKRGDGVTIDLQSGRYLRASISDGKSGERSSAEFFFTENDTTVQFRINSIDAFSVRAVMSAKRNMDRAEEVRKYLRYTKLPVLRNRQRRFFFGESELDGFGPGSASLGPPAEMSSGELEGRNSDLIDPKMKIDLMQSFPRVDKSGPF